MRSEDPTANIPVAVLDAVPVGPLPGRCRGTRRLTRSKVEVERVGPRHRQWRWKRRLWRGWLRPGKRRRLQQLQPRCGVIRLGQQRTHGSVSGGLPCLQPGDLVENLVHHEIKALELGDEILQDEAI